jgi:hypothetical protein
MQPSFTDWLNRTKAGPKPRKRLPAYSPRRQEASRVYAQKRAQFLKMKPQCERCRSAKSRDVHHKAGRHGGNYLNVSTWAAVCRPCHDWIHAHPKEAREKGWLV